MLSVVTACDLYPIPRKDGPINWLGGAVEFATFDTESRYLQVRIDGIDIDRTLFRTDHGLYCFLHTPF